MNVELLWSIVHPEQQSSFPSGFSHCNIFKNKLKRIINISVLVLVLITSMKAQPQVISEIRGIYKCKQLQSEDTSSLKHAFKSGQFTGHVRYFFMATDNQKSLTDYYAHAIGGGLRFETAKFHNFQFAISGFYIFNIGSSDLTKKDTQTGQCSRYELGLFDITNPANKKDLNRLEELNLKLNIKHSYIRIGRQLINTVFVNLQDGRMSPTATEGIWAEVNDIRKLKLQFGWLWGMSPRSTTRWYNPGRSIGIYPSGINPDGTKSQYSNNLKSKGLGIFGVTKEVNKNIKVQAWNMFTENIFNTAFLQTDISLPLKENAFLFAAGQIIEQDAINDGGNENQSKTYFPKGSNSLSFGARAGWKNNKWEASLNYNRITKSGRYLVPREWGVEPFFTFLPRERNEGLGDVHSFMIKANYDISGASLKTSLAAGYYHLPDVKYFALNKYGLPSYTQINADIRYIFTNTIKGLDAEFLVAMKLNNGKTYDYSRFIFNKVNLVQYNFVLNYTFR